MVDGLALGGMARGRVTMGELSEPGRIDGAAVSEMEDAGFDSNDGDDFPVQEAGLAVIGADEDPVSCRDLECSRPIRTQLERPLVPGYSELMVRPRSVILATEMDLSIGSLLATQKQLEANSSDKLPLIRFQ